MSENEEVQEKDSRKEISKKIIESEKQWNAIVNGLTNLKIKSPLYF